MTHGKAQRILIGTWAVAALLLIFALDVRIAYAAEKLDGAFGDLLQRGSVVPLLFLVMALLGGRELTRILQATGAKPHRGLALLLVAAMILAPWFSAAGWLGSSPSDVEGLYWPLVLVLAAGLLTGLATVLRAQPSGSTRDYGATLLIVAYLGIFASFGIQLRSGRDVPGQQGAWLLLLSLLVIKSSDIGAYFVGSAFGRRRLAPTISPGKSVEGAIGGLLASAAVAIALFYLSSNAGLFPAGHQVWAFLDDPAEGSRAAGGGAFSALAWSAGFGIVLSLTAQAGDLLESCFKRDAGTKDSGGILPQFGGILDLIDSPIVALPVAWLWLTKVWGVV